MQRIYLFSFLRNSCKSFHLSLPVRLAPGYFETPSSASRPVAVRQRFVEGDEEEWSGLEDRG